MSDESSKKADSDSHPENWTDHEQSDPQQVASSPPKGSDEKTKVIFIVNYVKSFQLYKNKLFNCYYNFR